MADDQWISLSKKQDEGQWQPLSAPQPSTAPGAMPTVGDVSVSEGSTGAATAATPPTADISFGDRTMMAIAQTPKSKMKYLKTMFGDENVQVGQDGSFMVKENGQWKRAETGIVSEVLASAPQMVGGTVGGIIGAGIGSLAGPFGTVGGAIAGRSAGAAMAHVVENWGLQKLGLMSEDDADSAVETMTKDMTINLLFEGMLRSKGAVKAAAGALGLGAAYGAATAEEGESKLGKAIDYGTKAAAVVGAASLAKGTLSGAKEIAKDVVPKVGANYAWTPLAKTLARDAKDVPEKIAKIVPGINSEDVGIVMRSYDDAAAVKANMKEVRAFQNQKLAGQHADKSLDPVSERLVDKSQKIMSEAKDQAFTNFKGRREALLNTPAVRNTDIPIDEAAGQFRVALHDLGAQIEYVNGVPKISRGVNPTGESILQIYGEQDLKAIDRVLEQMDVLGNKKTGSVLGEEIGDKTQVLAKSIKPDEYFKLRSLLDDVLERNGAYAQGDNAIGSRAAGALKQLRGALGDSAGTALKDVKMVGPNKQWTSAGDYFKKADSQYSKFRDAYDPFALPSKLGDKSKALDTLNKMLGAKGGSMEQAFIDMMTAAEITPTQHIGELLRLKAGRNLATYSSSSKGLGSALSDLTGRNPMDIGNALANQTMKRMSPITPKSKLAVEAVAKGSNFIKNLPPDQKLKMLTNPAISQFLNTVYGATQTYDQTQETLFSAAQQKLQGQ